jgi:signal transduction histidine kinase/CheY-like chemotaxis protein
VSVPFDTLDLVVRLSRPTTRLTAATALAARLGVENFLLFVRDPALGVLLPAPEFPQTIHGGPTWQSFLDSCSAPGRYTSGVDLAPGTSRRALALVDEKIAAILVSRTPVAPAESELRLIERLLPMLAEALTAEQQTVIAGADAAAAKDAASRAQALAQALEVARADASRLNAELHEEHRRKDEFLAMLAHELRNPLAPLVTSLELLRRGSERATLARPLNMMARQVAQLSRLVEDLLDVSRVSRGRIELRLEYMSLGDALTAALEASRPLLDARRHRVDFSLAQEPLPVNADSVRLMQVFSNLIQNAAKYTDVGGRISLSAARENNWAVVRLVDNGAGITAAMLPRIFDLFTQASPLPGRSQNGLGIGLTLVRALLELHGGQITAESAGVGHGSTFIARLPLAGAKAAAGNVHIPAAAESSPGLALRVLVVDDNQDAADSLAEMLRLMDHHAEAAYSGLTALQMATDFDAELVLLDLDLPDIDGYEVGRRLRRVSRREMRMVALTGFSNDADRRRARAAGFDEHVVKPITEDVLQAVTARATAQMAAGGTGTAR